MRHFTQVRSISCAICREVDIYLAISHGRALSTEIGFGEIDRTRIEIVILELTRNVLGHASSGELILCSINGPDGPGMLVEARDNGPGIPDIALALRDGYSTANTLGAGLPGVKRLMDEFEIDSTVGTGTTVQAIKWLRPNQQRTMRGGRQT